MKVLTVVGARPQFIKAAPVSRLLRREHHEVLLHTGQHYDDSMSDLFFRQLSIPRPDVNLGVGSGAHGAQTGAMLQGIESIAIEQRPDLVLVYGDTNSTLAGALAASKLHIRLAHVEAGLRSFDRRMPEEVNRVVADHVSDLLLCPTRTAVGNLAREGLTRGVSMVGDVMYDAFLEHVEVARTTCDVLHELGLQPRRYHLMTVHRAENVDSIERLSSILRGVQEAGMTVVFPVHPRTRKAIASSLELGGDVKMIEPVGYLEMLRLEADACTIVTDSGGVQKEAYFAGVPCITVRDNTEWLETVEAGWNVLVGSDTARIAAAMHDFRPDGERPAVFGDGHAAARVLAAITSAESAQAG